MRKFIVGLVALGCTLLPQFAKAETTLEYDILKEGEPIGREIVRISKEGGETKVNVSTQTDVKVLFLEFHYKHERNEVWKGNELISVVSQTNDDGTEHQYQLQKADGAYLIKVNGEDQTADLDTLPLTLWTKAVLNHPTLLSVIDAQPYQVSTVPVDEGHYRLDGDIQRELWFSKDGYLQKAAFKRKGFLIEFLRK